MAAKKRSFIDLSMDEIVTALILVGFLEAIEGNDEEAVKRREQLKGVAALILQTCREKPEEVDQVTKDISGKLALVEEYLNKTQDLIEGK